jgi:hypothetical protein
MKAYSVKLVMICIHNFTPPLTSSPPILDLVFTVSIVLGRRMLQIKSVNSFISYGTNAEEITGRRSSQTLHSVSAVVLSSFPHVGQHHDTGTDEICGRWISQI